MFFRNLTLFRFPARMRDALEALEARLDECRLKPVGPLELGSHGFVAPLGRDTSALVHGAGDCRWLALGGEEKILPAAVVNELLARKAAEIEARDSSRLGARARRRLREELFHDLLPRAFVRPVRTDASIDLEHGIVAVDTSSRKAAEQLLSELRSALGSFPALPLNAEVAPRAILTGWLAGERLPEGVELGDECELRDGMDRGALVKCQRQELDADEVAKHLEAGKQCTRLALRLDDHLAFVLGEDLVVRKLRFLEGAVEHLEGNDPESVQAELDARYALMCGELKRLFAMLQSAFRLSPADG